VYVPSKAEDLLLGVPFLVLGERWWVGGGGGGGVCAPPFGAEVFKGLGGGRVKLFRPKPSYWTQGRIQVDFLGGVFDTRGALGTTA